MPRVLVINAGSSSVKYQVVDADSGEALASGLVERIGEAQGALRHTVRQPDGTDRTHSSTPTVKDHNQALEEVLRVFGAYGPNLDEVGLAAVGHRVVQGGSLFSAPTVVDQRVLDGIESLTPLAPLHNPGALEGLKAAREKFTDLPHVVVFDTSFHQTMPEYAYSYAVPREWAKEHAVRRYGFHGTSHAYVSREAARLLGRLPSQVNVIVAHLGNGASMSAVRAGECVDTSMGMTPLQGLVMGTRSGDLDPAVIAHICTRLDLTAAEVDTILNKHSGLLGMTGVNDMREVRELAESGDHDAALARALYTYRIKTYAGAYYAALGKLDAIVFTAGVGENDAGVRADSLDGLEGLGIAVDEELNTSGEGARIISPARSRVKVMVIPTNEEYEIARQTMAAVARQ